MYITQPNGGDIDLVAIVTRLLQKYSVDATFSIYYKNDL